MFIDFQLTYNELNALFGGAYLEWGRFLICVVISALSIAVMMFVGIWFPARKAMKVELAVALHGE